MRSTRGLRGPGLGLCSAVMAACLVAASAQAATDAYPAGGGTFSGSAQGWQVTDASCNVPAFCTASGGYDGANGNPAGSIAANTTISVNLLTLFKSTVTVQSPDFTVAGAGDGTLHLDRQFDSGSLVDLAPQASYTVTLIDRTAGGQSVPLTESLSSASGFIGKDSAVSVKVGHVYAISIATETSSTVAGTAFGGGTTSLRFDNVSLKVQTSGDGAGSRGGAGGLTDARLLSLVKGSLVGPARLKGNRLWVKVRCPAAVGRTCRIAVRGMLRKRKPATLTRRVKVRKGKAKRAVLKVKPRARKQVATRKRLLFKVTVRAGKAKATFHKRLKLVRR